MKTLINNEGKKVNVTPLTYDSLKKEFYKGVWACVATDCNKKTHCFILEENFLNTQN